MTTLGINQIGNADKMLFKSESITIRIKLKGRPIYMQTLFFAHNH